MKKLCTLLLLCGLILFLLAGCTGASTEVPDTSEPPAQNTQPEDSSAPTEEEPVLPESVTISQWRVWPNEFEPYGRTDVREITDPEIIAALCGYFNAESVDHADTREFSTDMVYEEFYVDLHNGAAFAVRADAAYSRVGTAVAMDEEGDPSLTDDEGGYYALTAEAHAYLLELMEGWRPEPAEKISIYRMSNYDEPPEVWEITDPEVIAEIHELFTVEAVDFDYMPGWRTVPTYHIDLHNGLSFGVYIIGKPPCAQIGSGLFVREDGSIGTVNQGEQYGLSQDAYDYFCELMRELDTEHFEIMWQFTD